MDELHEHEERIVRFLERYWREFLRSPSLDDICQHVRLPSKDHVYRDLSKLEEKGYIRRPLRMARSITPAQKAERGALQSRRGAAILRFGAVARQYRRRTADSLARFELFAL